MTAALGNTAQNSPWGTGIDGTVYPQFIGYAQRAPTTNDIYTPGTMWQDNSVSPPVVYLTTGAGVWTSYSPSSFTSLTVNGTSTLTGTTNINTSGAAVTTIGTGGTGAVNIGNATGNTAVTGTLTTSAGITLTTGNLTLSGASSKILINAGTSTTASLGVTAAMSGTPGAVTVTSSAVTTSSVILFSRKTTGGTPGQVSITAQSAGAFTLTSTGNETSTFNYVIIN